MDVEKGMLWVVLRNATLDRSRNHRLLAIISVEKSSTMVAFNVASCRIYTKLERGMKVR